MKNVEHNCIPVVFTGKVGGSFVGETNCTRRLLSMGWVKFTPCLIHVSTSSMFYVQFLCLQIPKAQKDSKNASLFALLGSARVKVACRTLMKLTPLVNFINILLAAFAPIFLCQKITKPNRNLRKAAQNSFVPKS